MSGRSILKNSNTYILYAVGGVLALAVVTLVVYFLFFRNSLPDENGPCAKDQYSVINGEVTRNPLCTENEDQKFEDSLLKAAGMPLNFDPENADEASVQKYLEFYKKRAYYQSSLIGGKTYYFPAQDGLKFVIVNGIANLDDSTAVMKGSEIFPFSGLQTNLKSVLNDLPEEYTLSLRFTDNVGTFTLP